MYKLVGSGVPARWNMSNANLKRRTTNVLDLVKCDVIMWSRDLWIFFNVDQWKIINLNVTHWHRMTLWLWEWQYMIIASPFKHGPRFLNCHLCLGVESQKISSCILAEIQFHGMTHAMTWLRSVRGSNSIQLFLIPRPASRNTYHTHPAHAGTYNIAWLQNNYWLPATSGMRP